MAALGHRAKRSSGELEAAVLETLWGAAGPLNAAEVRGHLVQLGFAIDGELAYTTVVTVLTRLKQKGMLRRYRDGRAFRYAPVADETGLAARRLKAVLDSTSDRDAVLMRFVSDLSDRDEQVLRAMLDGPTRNRTGA